MRACVPATDKKDIKCFSSDCLTVCNANGRVQCLSTGETKDTKFDRRYRRPRGDFYCILASFSSLDGGRFSFELPCSIGLREYYSIKCSPELQLSAPTRHLNPSWVTLHLWGFGLFYLHLFQRINVCLLFLRYNPL